MPKPRRSTKREEVRALRSSTGTAASARRPLLVVDGDSFARASKGLCRTKTAFGNCSGQSHNIHRMTRLNTMQVASVINRNFFISATNAVELSVSSCSQITQQSLKAPGTLVRLHRRRSPAPTAAINPPNHNRQNGAPTRQVAT